MRKKNAKHLSMSKTVKERLKKRKRADDICTIKRPFQQKQKVLPSTLIPFADDATFLELANTPLAYDFIKDDRILQSFKKFIKRISHKDPKNENINCILQDLPLQRYNKSQKKIKFFKESFRTQAMKLVNAYMNYQLTIHNSLITSIKIQSFIHQKCEYRLNYPVMKHHEELKCKQIFDFYYKHIFIRLDPEVIIICDILVKKVKINSLLDKILSFLFIK